MAESSDRTKLRQQPKDEHIENADLRAPPKFAPEVCLLSFIFKSYFVLFLLNIYNRQSKIMFLTVTNIINK